MPSIYKPQAMGLDLDPQVSMTVIHDTPPFRDSTSADAVRGKGTCPIPTLPQERLTVPPNLPPQPQVQSLYLSLAYDLEEPRTHRTPARPDGRWDEVESTRVQPGSSRSTGGEPTLTPCQYYRRDLFLGFV